MGTRGDRKGTTSTCFLIICSNTLKNEHLMTKLMAYRHGSNSRIETVCTNIYQSKRDICLTNLLAIMIS